MPRRHLAEAIFITFTPSFTVVDFPR
jgi:hypothetical protein